MIHSDEGRQFTALSWIRFTTGSDEIKDNVIVMAIRDPAQHRAKATKAQPGEQTNKQNTNDEFSNNAGNNI